MRQLSHLTRKIKTYIYSTIPLCTFRQDCSIEWMKIQLLINFENMVSWKCHRPFWACEGLRFCKYLAAILLTYVFQDETKCSRFLSDWLSLHFVASTVFNHTQPLRSKKHTTFQLSSVDKASCGDLLQKLFNVLLQNHFKISVRSNFLLMFNVIKQTLRCAVENISNTAVQKMTKACKFSKQLNTFAFANMYQLH